MRLLIATGNAGKVREYAELFGDLTIDIVGLKDVGLGKLKVDEPYNTYEGNAAHKARIYASASRLPVLADDSGLEVAALGGRPGVYTARYAGAGATDRDRYMKLLGELITVPDEKRQARFVCVIAIAEPGDEQIEMVRGECKGLIAHTPGEGKHGFGFDPVFIPEGYEVTFDQLEPAEKHRISHRGRATAALLPLLQRWDRHG